MSVQETDSEEAAHGAVNCQQALGMLFEFLDAELPDADGDRIREHLAYCEPCLAEYDVEEHVRALVRRSCSECAPVELHVRIRESLTILRSQIT
jgi:anti-sigma factor (TIGR02949 family)